MVAESNSPLDHNADLKVVSISISNEYINDFTDHVYSTLMNHLIHGDLMTAADSQY